MKFVLILCPTTVNTGSKFYHAGMKNAMLSTCNALVILMIDFSLTETPVAETPGRATHCELQERVEMVVGSGAGKEGPLSCLPYPLPQKHSEHLMDCKATHFQNHRNANVGLDC